MNRAVYISPARVHDGAEFLIFQAFAVVVVVVQVVCLLDCDVVEDICVDIDGESCCVSSSSLSHPRNLFVSTGPLKDCITAKSPDVGLEPNVFCFFFLNFPCWN
jgi:hypothetical protein